MKTHIGQRISIRKGKQAEVWVSNSALHKLTKKNPQIKKVKT